MTEIGQNISSCGVTEYVADIYHNEDNMEAPYSARKEVGPELNTNKTDN